MSLFHVVFYEPIYNLLVGLYATIAFRDIGIAIALATVTIRLLLWPLNQKMIRSQKAVARLQPEIEAIKKAHPDDKQRQQVETMALYAREKINPFASCLPLLIQLPILIALYQVFSKGLAGGSLDTLYPFIPNPGTIHGVSLGISNLAKPSIILALLAGAAQFAQSRQLIRTRPPESLRQESGKKEDTMALMNTQMMYMMPIVTVLIGIKLPGGLSLYFFVSSVCQYFQQWLLLRDVPKTVEHHESADPKNTNLALK